MDEPQVSNPNSLEVGNPDSADSNPMLPGESSLLGSSDNAATAEAYPQVDTAPPPAATAVPVPTRKSAPWNVIGHLQFALLALTIALFIITFVVQAFRIPSGSMENTLLVGDYLLVDKTRFGPSGPWKPFLPYRNIHRGDIIVFRYPVDPTQHFVKRVIGLPGDRVRLWHSRVYINGHALTEPYVVFKEHFPDEFRDNFPRGDWINENVNVEWATKMRTLVQDGELIVPSGHYFVLGDNRDQSLDSRYWGFVPRENIIGRPLVIYFSMVEASDDDDAVESSPADDKLFILRARIFHVFGDMRWRRILRLVP
jgi:signal peptidase I